MQKPEILKCKKCSNTWLELLRLRQYHAFHNVVLGQEPPPISSFEAFILKCPRCNTLHDLSLELTPRTPNYEKWRGALKELGIDTDEDPLTKQQPISIERNPL